MVWVSIGYRCDIVCDWTCVLVSWTAQKESLPVAVQGEGSPNYRTSTDYYDDDDDRGIAKNKARHTECVIQQKGSKQPKQSLNRFASLDTRANNRRKRDAMTKVAEISDRSACAAWSPIRSHPDWIVVGSKVSFVRVRALVCVCKRRRMTIMDRA